MPQADNMVKGLRFARVMVWLVYAFFIVALVILGMDFILQLFNASTDAAFTRWVYRNADQLLAPFRGIFPSKASENGSVIDFAVLFAMIMYGLFALGMHALIKWVDQKISERQWSTTWTTDPVTGAPKPRTDRDVLPPR